MNLMDDSTIEMGAKKRDLAANTAQRPHSKGSSPSKGYHAHKQTQEFTQSGFDLVDRINDPRRAQNRSMQEIVQMNDDMEDAGE